jgi:uncharacterized lipoprotein YmbA
MRTTLVGFVALAVLVGGCSLLSPRHDPSRFYTLAARQAGTSASPSASTLSVVVGPVTLPAYLDRNEVAVRVSPSELRYALTERWAEPLVQNFTRVLIENLGRALGSESVSGIVNATTPTPDYSVEVVVIRFEAGADGNAQATMRWAVRDKARKVVRIRQSQHDRQATSASVEGGVNALSAALCDLADEIASVLRELAAAEAVSPRARQ